MAGIQSTDRKRLLRYNIREKQAMYQAYMPWIKGGGLFLPLDPGDYSMGEHLYVLLNIPDDNHVWPLHCVVGWITNKEAQRGATPGIGIAIQADCPEKENLLTKIDLMLGPMPKDKKTHTL